MTLAPPGPARWAPAEGITVRGTVVLLPGRGEHPALYHRLGTRLAFDGYRVTTSEADLGGDPVVLLGHDTGGLRALELATETPVAGVAVTGLPLEPTAPVDGWPGELDARTACPVHRALLAGDREFRRDALRDPVPGTIARPAAPVLVLHGEADRVASPEAARAFATTLPRARFVLVAGGHHDVLNDLDHRSVAAELVQFLEWLRAGTSAPALVRG